MLAATEAYSYGTQVMMLALVLLLSQPLPVAAGPRTVRTSGEGRVSAAPDIAHVTLGVETQDPSVARANADASGRMKKVTATLEKAGIAAKDVRTVRYAVDVQRSFEKGPPGTVVGYHVVNEVLVTVRDLPRLGAILDQLVAAGANTVGGVSLDKEDVSAERARALERAMSDARARASVLAKAAGGSLGEALQINEAVPPPVVPLPYALRAASAKADVPVSAGELEIVATVEVTFALR